MRIRDIEPIPSGSTGDDESVGTRRSNSRRVIDSETQFELLRVVDFDEVRRARVLDVEQLRALFEVVDRED